MSRDRENLTVANINQMLATGGLINDQICQISSELHRYRDLIKEARHRLISHLDKQSMFSSDPLGAPAEGEVSKFYNNLQCYVDLVGTAIGEGPLDFSVTSSRGDAFDLISTLKRGVAVSQTHQRSSTS
jgi:hypothetical protein